MEGGVRHRLLGVVDIQEKSRLHPAYTQIPVAEGYRDGTREKGGDLAAGPAASTRALTNTGPVPSECRGQDLSGREWWREVGVVERSGDPVWRRGLREGRRAERRFSPRSRGDAPSARTGGP